MTSFLFDMRLTATVAVEADDLETAAELLGARLSGYNPDWVLPSLGDAHARVTEISPHAFVQPGTGADLTLVMIGDEPVEVEVDAMDRPVVCSRYLELDDLGGVECAVVYDEARGDGYAGRCPACADAEQDDED